jgi:uracil-DNA glycosylase
VDVDGVLSEVAGQVADCKRCQLSFSRKNAVPGEGPSRAKIMLIGEGPGFYENEQGRPFVGASGSFLDELLQKAGVNRKAVFITNVVKCRPPGNRDPLPDELQACSEYLDRQIAAINPLIIVTLGRYSMSKFLSNAKISEVHGKPVWVRGRMIVPMFHPAAALHQPSLKVSVEQDFARLPDFIKQAQSGAGVRKEPGTQQMPGVRHSEQVRQEPAIRQQPVVGAQLEFTQQALAQQELGAGVGCPTGTTS